MSTPSPLGSSPFSSSPFVYLSLEDRGYRAYVMKKGQDPIPHDGIKQLLPSTEEYRRWMYGWNMAYAYHIELIKEEQTKELKNNGPT